MNTDKEITRMPRPSSLEQALNWLRQAELRLGFYHVHTRRLLKIVNRYRFGD